MGKDAWINLNSSNGTAGHTRGTVFSSINYYGTNSNVKVVDALGLSFRTVNELNEMIDTNLSGRPCFQCKTLTINGEPLEFYSRDAIECIRCLYGDPRFAQHLAFAPERHYTSYERTTRIYNEIYTGDWWWKVQVRPTLFNQKFITHL
jgi:hypothetical protein